MVTTYTINIVNQSADDQTFWCFLAPPEELKGMPGVFANSAANLLVPSYSPNANMFTIPVQFMVGASASNQAVGLNVRVDSIASQPTDLGVSWSANYYNVPPQRGPDLKKSGTLKDEQQLEITTNAFNKPGNEDQGWFSNMSYGVQSANGFIGMTWSPAPQDTRTWTPKLQFFVATGSYGENELASWTDISSNSAVISAPTDFQYGQTTVTLDGSGNWQVTPGKPSSQGRRSHLDRLIASHHLLAQAHARLVPFARPLGSSQTDTVKTVQWNSSLEDPAGPLTFISGTLTVNAALLAAFSTFVLSGVEFQITSAPARGTTISFNYSGTRSAQAIKDLFTAGAKILLQS